MSIGKSALKRVENNGYSKVKTEAPDMQNSSVITAPAEEVMEKLVTPVEKKTTSAKKTTATKKTTKKSVAPKQNAPQNKNAFVTCMVGEDLPYYLL